MLSPADSPSTLAAVGQAIRSGASWLAELIGNFARGIVNRIADIALPLVVATGCQAATDSTTVVASAPFEPKLVMPPIDAGGAAEARKKNERANESREPKPLGDFSITFYYVIGEEEIPSKPVVANDNHGSGSESGSGSDIVLASAAKPSRAKLYTGTCEVISEVSREFQMELAIQGTGKLHDGRVLNFWGACNCPESPCYKVTSAAWGWAGTGRPLQPFRTVAVDPKVVKLGSLLYVPLLEGRLMPGRYPWGGFVHDGCVVADDVGGGIRGEQLDLFVGRQAWFLGMSGREGKHAWARNVPVYDGAKHCERKDRQVGRRKGGV